MKIMYLEDSKVTSIILNEQHLKMVEDKLHIDMKKVVDAKK